MHHFLEIERKADHAGFRLLQHNRSAFFNSRREIVQHYTRKFAAAPRSDHIHTFAILVDLSYQDMAPSEGSHDCGIFETSNYSF